MSQSDYQMALLLQQQFRHEAETENPSGNLVYKHSKQRNQTKSLTDPSWELIDPTPNIHILFVAFNERYFWNKLFTVCVDWSKRMTTCAGVCSYQGRGGLCRITLSEPLLKLRPRKDLVETLLHEMIHAYLFLTKNDRDRDGHGPEFHKHMYRINGEAGTNITVYHDFHDEVRLYQQHWWRCNGPCQHRKPYFGMVRRATNRAPGPNDRWWAEHQRNCGGSFIKVKEPEKQQKNKSQKENKPIASSKDDIRNFYPVLKGNNSSPTLTANNVNKKPNGAITSNIAGFKDLKATRPKNALSNSTSTIVINKKPTTTKQDSEQSEPTKSHLVQPKSNVTNAFTGTGQTLSNQKPNDNADYATVRNHWINKFQNDPNKVPKTTKRVASNNPSVADSSKRVKPNLNVNKEPTNLASDNANSVDCPVCQRKCKVNEMDAHLDWCLAHQPGLPEKKPLKCPVCEQKINGDSFDKHVEECVNKVFNDANDDDFSSDDCVKATQELIPCLVCNKPVLKVDLNSHLDECMGDDIFTNENDSDDCNNGGINLKSDDKEKKYNCPVCFEQFLIVEMSSHLDNCLLNDSETAKDNSVVNTFLDEPF